MDIRDILDYIHELPIDLVIECFRYLNKENKYPYVEFFIHNKVKFISAILDKYGDDVIFRQNLFTTLKEAMSIRVGWIHEKYLNNIN
jgi:hypothetical protein